VFAAPRGVVAGENPRIGQAKAVNALLDITDEKAVGLRTFAGHGLDDRFLGFVDILIFIDKNKMESAPPLLGDFAGAAVLPQQAQGELFKIMIIQTALAPLGLLVSAGELPRQVE